MYDYNAIIRHLKIFFRFIKPDNSIEADFRRINFLFIMMMLVMLAKLVLIVIAAINGVVLN